jgi:endonuclease/exonuclease/phosphatase (EEP) superfamily protein YafD
MGLLRIAVAANLVTLALLALLLQIATDIWWPATVIAYAPVWPWLVPTPLLLLLVLASRRARTQSRHLLLALGAGGALWLLALAEFNLPLGPRANGEVSVRVLTYNLGNVPRAARPRLRELIEREHIDLALLQECRIDPADPLWRGLWVQSENMLCAVAPRAPTEFVLRDPSDFWADGGAGMMTRYRLDSAIGPLTIINLHVETPRTGFEELRGGLTAGIKELGRVAAQREREMAEAMRWAGAAGERLVFAGDFNAVPQSRLLARHFGDLLDAWRAAGFGFGHTKRTRWHGVRIDHVLLGGALAPVAVRTLPSLGGDHQPLIVEIGVRER